MKSKLTLAEAMRRLKDHGFSEKDIAAGIAKLGNLSESKKGVKNAR